MKYERMMKEVREKERERGGVRKSDSRYRAQGVTNEVCVYGIYVRTYIHAYIRTFYLIVKSMHHFIHILTN